MQAMIERFQQEPRNIDSDDEDMLSLLGHRIERWDILKDTSLTFEDRKRKLIEDIDNEMNVLSAEVNDEVDESELARLDQEIGTLERDAESVSNLIEGELQALYDEKTEFYKRARQLFLETL